MTFFLITYIKHLGHKHIDEAVITEGENGIDLMTHLKEMNRTKLLSTTEYRYYDLTALCEKSNLQLVLNEKPEENEDVD